MIEDEGNDQTFNPNFNHPGELDTPREIKSIFPFTFFNSSDGSDGTTETFTSKVGSTIRNVLGKGPKTTEDADHYTVRTAGSGRRSSLARACSYTSNKATDLKAMTGLSFKMQPKKLPTMSYKPPMGRRESESIFVAHEEFEGLPQFPGDRELKVSHKGSQLSLGDIEEGGSDSALTPRFYTPPRMASPAFASEWEQDNQAIERGRRVDFGRSPESAYEPTVVGA